MSDFIAIDDVLRCREGKEDACRELAKTLVDQVREKEERTWVYRFCETPLVTSTNHVYPNAEAFLEHFDNIKGPLVEAMEGNLFDVDRIYMSGPARELDKIKSAAAADEGLAVTYFETIEGSGVSNFELGKAGGTGAGGEESSFTIFPVFKVNDWSRVRAEFVDPCVRVASGEEGCLYYSYAQNTETNQLVCRERYRSAADAVRHLEGVGPVLTSCIQAGIVELEYSCVYASKEALEVAKPAFEPFGTELKEITRGFERIVLASSSS